MCVCVLVGIQNLIVTFICGYLFVCENLYPRKFVTNFFGPKWVVVCFFLYLLNALKAFIFNLCLFSREFILDIMNGNRQMKPISYL